MYHKATITDDDRLLRPDDSALLNGVFYVTVHGPGSWVAHHHYPNRPLLVGLTDAVGHDLSDELPGVVVPDDNEEDESFLVLNTKGHYRYPLTLRIIPA